MTQQFRHEVTAAEAGDRLDRLAANVAGISRAAARRLVDEGRVLLNGSPAAADRRLAMGDVVAVGVPAPPPVLVPEDVPFDVVYEDDQLAVVDKPAGVATHPGAGRRHGTLAAGILARWPEIEGVGEEGRWGLVHRLDRETSGLLVVAKSPAMLAALQDSLRARRIHREYTALVHGRLQSDTGTIDAPIGRDPRRPTRFRVVADGRSARTHYRVAQRWEAVTLLEVTLETGRTHQIRVHMSSIDHPLVDDAVYGGRSLPVASPGRVWLHAGGLEFPHPVSGKLVSFVSDLPPDLAESLAALDTAGP